MGIMSKILGGDDGRAAGDYVELDTDEFETQPGTAAMHVHIADLNDQTDVIDIKDAIYDGDFVIADITRHSTSDGTTEHLIDELRQVTKEVDGDIVRKGDDQLVIAPTGVTISRTKLNEQ
ncbi:MAG: hypothetical protein J07HB67_02513 [halophilic archaeon J07HB67]|jgi:Uncharacterized conserved protein|nr:MAG: hypothetical protein J07HB67_02513 [halophilic archaeon J07HB67]